MMGQHDRSEALFYYFRLEDQVPETHLLRLIEKHVSFAFVREKLKDSYSETGRPSIDPELLLRILLIGYLYGITSERKLVEELRMHLAWRWFTGSGIRSGDSASLHVLQESARDDFRSRSCSSNCLSRSWRIVWKPDWCKESNLSVDGSFVEANASKESRIPREQLAEAAQVNHTVRQYLVELEQQNPTEEPVHEQEQVSTTDPDSTYATKGGTPARLGYYDNYLVDNPSCVIVGVQATAARMSQETVAAQDMLTRFAQWQGREPESVAADATYGNGEFLQWLMERGITPYMRTRDSALTKEQSALWSRAFYVSSRKQQLPLSRRPATQLWRTQCPEPHPRLYRDPQTLWGVRTKNAMHHLRRLKYLAIHMHEPARQRARALANTPGFAERTAAKKEGGSAVRGTQEPDRTTPAAFAQNEVRSRAVLPGSGCPKHQAAGPLPQPTDNPHCGSRLLAEVRRKTRSQRPSRPESTFRSRTFSTPTGVSTSLRRLFAFSRVNE